MFPAEMLYPSSLRHQQQANHFYHKDRHYPLVSPQIAMNSDISFCAIVQVWFIVPFCRHRIFSFYFHTHIWLWWATMSRLYYRNVCYYFLKRQHHSITYSNVCYYFLKRLALTSLSQVNLNFVQTTVCTLMHVFFWNHNAHSLVVFFLATINTHTLFLVRVANQLLSLPQCQLKIKWYHTKLKHCRSKPSN